MLKKLNAALVIFAEHLDEKIEICEELVDGSQRKRKFQDSVDAQLLGS